MSIFDRLFRKSAQAGSGREPADTPIPPRPSPIPRMTSLGIRFQIDKVQKLGDYGTQCWKIVWQALDPEALTGALLKEGDTQATLRRLENIYCIAIEGFIDCEDLCDKLQSLPVFRECAATPPFIRGSEIASEPLVEAGRIDGAGRITGKGFNAANALAALGKGKVEPLGPSPSGPVPGRRKPASPRTAALPEVSHLNELDECLTQGFTPPDCSRNFVLTPAELCDVAERYADRLIIGWNVEDGRLSADKDVMVSLSWKADPAKSIQLVGLYRFPNAREAKSVWVDKGVYERDMPVERMLGIRGRFALNFTRGSYAYESKDMVPIPADELWTHIWKYCRQIDLPIDE